MSQALSILRLVFSACIKFSYRSKQRSHVAHSCSTRPTHAGTRLLNQTHPHMNENTSIAVAQAGEQNDSTIVAKWPMCYTVLCSFRGLTLLSLTQLHYTSYTATQLPYIQVYKHVYSAQHIKELNNNTVQHTRYHTSGAITETLIYLQNLPTTWPGKCLIDFEACV